jgi:Leu/Phe-tRNA-protein transferase
MTDHLQQFGGVEIPAEEYARKLAQALAGHDPARPVPPPLGR